MLIKYYNNEELAYTNRKRYHKFSFSPFSQEEQRSVLLGDGAKTQVKTSVDNICNYVTINDTRWFVTSYIYMNGKQVTLNLQRDVIGEFGVDGCFGKIERGYTNSILKNRKELSLNQILKERKQLKPNTNVYGNYYIKSLDSTEQDVHKDEIWGLIYMVKPAEGQVVIPIPAFTPDVVDYTFIPNNTLKSVSNTARCEILIPVRTNNNRSYAVTIKYDLEDNIFYEKEPEIQNIGGDFGNPILFTGLPSSSLSGEISNLKQLFWTIGEMLLENNGTFGGVTLPNVPVIDNSVPNYNNITILKDGQYYSYTMTNLSKETYGSMNDDKILATIKKVASDWEGWQATPRYPDNFSGFDRECYITTNQVRYNYNILTDGEAGQLTIDVSNQNLVDEPYYILAFPLFNTTIVGTDKEYKIDKDKAFSVFNTVIQTLSGDNGYLVDAQIYPYCPVLTSVTAEINGYPFFTINSTLYEHDCLIQLYPSADIKKEYIQRVYSIISPEQSGKFDFNFYDYITEVNNVNGVNYAQMKIKVKTALKPFAIISSAVIQADDNSLMGIKYSSDLRGSQPSSNGFECSLASNAFETYKRQNSNYQQIFALQKEELQKQHSVELVNDITSTVVNTASATAMGAIAGNAMADAGIGNLFGSKAIGAGVGAGVAGATVGAAMIAQTVMNNELRDYEEYLQQANFDLNIGTVKNLPNSVNRVSSFNEIILKDFWFIIETYECSDYEKTVVDNFIQEYGYGIGVFDYVANYQKDGWFLRSTLVKSHYAVNLHLIAEKELMGGIYFYEQS